MSSILLGFIVIAFLVLIDDWIIAAIMKNDGDSGIRISMVLCLGVLIGWFYYLIH